MREHILAGWLLCAVAGAAATAETIDRTYSESFALEPGAVLQLLHGDGDVLVRPWAEDRLEVEVRYHATVRGIGGPRDFEVDFERRGDTIRVRGREVGAGFFLGGMQRTHEHRYSIRAPSHLDLDLRGDDGDVTVQDWEADVRVESGDGDVTIDGLRGTLDVELDDGDLELLDCAVEDASLQLEDGDVRLRGGGGDWSVRLDDGDVDARDWGVGSLFLRTEDGDVDLDLAPGPRLALEIESDDGDVTVDLPRGASARFDLFTDDGAIRVRLHDSEIETRDEHRTRGLLGGGDGEIEIRTQDGDITLRDAG